MNFIERIFAVSPDQGDGSFEWLLFAVPVAGLLILWQRRQARHRRGADAAPHRRG